MPRNRSSGSYGPGGTNHGSKNTPEAADLGLQYYVLPDDPLAALNILREAAGLEPLSEQSNEPK